MNRSVRSGVAALLRDLDERSPAGFAIGLHISFTSPRYMFQTYPKRWADEYASSGLLLQDPTIRWGMGNVGWVLWSDLEAIDTHGVLDRARDHGLMNGVTIALFDEWRSIASFARSDRDYEAAEIADLEAIFADLHRSTAGIDALGEDDRMALKDLSVRLSH